jgi:tetratricopeptide (TPR) repeat protein
MKQDYDYAGVRKGEALAKLGDRDGAIDEFERVVAKKPDYDYAYKAWGRWLLEWKDYAGAAEQFRRGACANPADAEYDDLLNQALIQIEGELDVAFACRQ